jgi:hypothetical protein
MKYGLGWKVLGRKLRPVNCIRQLMNITPGGKKTDIEGTIVFIM